MIDPYVPDIRALRFHLLAACMMHMEGAYSTETIAWKNCNPGNLEGKPGEYRVYPSRIAGYKALIEDIAANEGKLTVRQFIAKYAPPNENNTSLYLDVVTTLSGIGKDEDL